MAQVFIQNNTLNIISYDEIVSSSLDTSNNSWRSLRSVETPDILKTCNEDKSIQCCSFSQNGEYFAVCYYKVLIIYNTTTWSIFCQGTAERKAVSIQFFPKSNVILVADKSGCVTFYSYDEGSLTKTDLVLGHNSMLTGALITEDERYVLTCDRDEKIRISNYPNVYNIESYCLGHEQFVSGIDFLLSDKRVLMSSSGDGAIKFWNFVKGQEIMQYRRNIDERVPVIKITSFLNEQNTLVAVLEYNLTVVTILNIKGNLDDGLNYEVFKNIELSNTPWDVTFWQGNFISLLPDKTSPINIYSFNEKNAEKSFDNIKKYITDNYESILNTSNKISDNIQVLFKRDIDNVQEYQERKKARLSKNKTNEIV